MGDPPSWSDYKLLRRQGRELQMYLREEGCMGCISGGGQPIVNSSVAPAPNYS